MLWRSQIVIKKMRHKLQTAMVGLIPPFQGDKPAEKPTEQDGTSSEVIENTPDYLSDIDPVRRKEIIDTSSETTRDMPGAIICGGNANRILYEAYTGKTMF